MLKVCNCCFCPLSPFFRSSPKTSYLKFFLNVLLSQIIALFLFPIPFFSSPFCGPFFLFVACSCLTPYALRYFFDQHCWLKTNLNLFKFKLNEEESFIRTLNQIYIDKLFFDVSSAFLSFSAFSLGRDVYSTMFYYMNFNKFLRSKFTQLQTK